MSGESVRLRHIASLNTACSSSEARPYVALEDLESWRGQLLAEADIGVREPGGGNGIASVDMGDVLFGKLRPYLAKSWVADRPAYASTELLCMRPTDGVDSRWLGFVALSLPFVQWAVATSEGTKMPRTSWEKMGDYRLSLPPAAEQRAIADFLDAETARIDALVAKKRRLIQLIGERRISLMSAGVSGRLRPTGQHKASSLPWLDRLPEHWDEVGLTLVARLGSGHTPSRRRDDWWIESECTIPWITTGEVARLRSDRMEYIEETRENISPIGLENSAAAVHPAGTVVLCRTASAGYSGIMRSDMATSQDFATWTCGPLLRPRFLLLCLRAMRNDLLGRLAMGSTHKTIYMPDIQSLRVPLPPVEEQDEIVEAVWRQLDRDGRIEDLLSRQIDLLTGRRQALISATVTGEFDVPDSIVKEAL